MTANIYPCFRRLNYIKLGNDGSVYCLSAGWGAFVNADDRYLSPDLHKASTVSATRGLFPKNSFHGVMKSIWAMLNHSFLP
jgi:hypothetical protein